MDGTRPGGLGAVGWAPGRVGLGSVDGVEEDEGSYADGDHDQGEEDADYCFPEDRADYRDNEHDGPGALKVRG